MTKIEALGERAHEISAIQRVLKDHIKDAAVRTVVAHQCAAAAKSARSTFFHHILKKKGEDNGE